MSWAKSSLDISDVFVCCLYTKEFFRVTCEEIEVEKTNHSEVVEFTKLAKAEQY